MRRRPDARQLGELYDRFGPALYRYALMILADPAAAEDAVHHQYDCGPLPLRTGEAQNRARGDSMMDEDRELESTLRRYRPAPPSVNLRTLIVSRAADRGRGRTMWLACAAVIVAAILLQSATASILGTLPSSMTGMDAARREHVERLAAALGGGPEAREAAERLVAREESWQERAAAESPAAEPSWNR